MTRRLAQWLTPSRRLGVPIFFSVLFSLFWAVHLYSTVSSYGLAARPANDFVAFYTAGHFLAEGQTERFYDFEAQKEFQRTLHEEESEDFSFFVSPPFAAVLFLPFSFVPAFLGLIFWWLFGLFMLWLSIWLLQRELPGLHRYKTAMLFGLCFLFHPVFLWFILGQASTLILLIYTAIFILLRRRRDFWAGFVLGLLLFKPQLGLWPAVLLLYRRRWWAILGGFLGSLVWLFLGFAISPSSMFDFVEFSRELFQFIRGEEYHSWGLVSLYGFGAVLADGLSRSLGSVLAWGATAAGAVILFWKWRKVEWLPGLYSWDMQIAASFALMTILSPHLFLYDLTLLLLPVAIVFAQPQNETEKDSVLAWTALLWLSALVTEYVSLATIRLWGFGVQWVSLVIVLWSLRVFGLADLTRE